MLVDIAASAVTDAVGAAGTVTVEVNAIAVDVDVDVVSVDVVTSTLVGVAGRGAICCTAGAC